MKPVKDEPAKPAKGAAVSSSKPTSSTGPVSEDEIRAVLMHKALVTTQDLVANFKSRLRSKEVCILASSVLFTCKCGVFFIVVKGTRRKGLACRLGARSKKGAQMHR